MKQYIILVLLFCTSSSLAQKNHGINWIQGTGYSYKIHFKNVVPYESIFDLNFNYYFSDGSSCISDSDGNFKILCNGFKLMDSTGTTIEGGDTITPTKLSIWEDGFSLYSQFSIILPFRNDIYYVLTATASDNEFDTHWMQTSPYQSFDLLLYSKVDMKMNNGLGKVVKKAIPIEENKLLSRTQMMACRHADGVNWWLLKQAKDTNLVYKYIVTEDSVYDVGVQGMGEPHWGNNDIKGQIMFNTKGTQYATVAYGLNLVFLADFDRCNGNISNPQIRNLPIHSRSASILTLDTLAVGVCFSSNDSLLYVVKDYNLYQLDLHDPDSLTAWYRVANMDTTYDQFQKWSALYPGPDGKIYVGNWNGLGKAMSVIDNPNVKGVGCNFCPKCLQFGTIGAKNPPCMPNYELGKDSALLVGCTPVGTTQYEVGSEQVVVYPNPSNYKIKVESIKYKDATKQLYNSVGQMVLSTKQNVIDVSNLPSGVYYLRVENQVVKVIIE